MNSTPQDEEVLDGLMGQSLLQWQHNEDGINITLSNGAIITCLAVVIWEPIENGVH